MEKNNLIKRDFGSFFSSNVDELINLSITEYKSPQFKVNFNPDDLRDLKNKLGSAELKKKLFFLTNEFTFLNHAAFGLTFKPVLK